MVFTLVMQLYKYEILCEMLSNFKHIKIEIIGAALPAAPMTTGLKRAIF